MPRWKALPEELDPQVREFAGHLRRLVDRSGLSLAAVADRTGYSKTSWERYLNGRLLAPKGAIVALAEVTGTQLHHLTTMWELAERAWSRSEMRHDMTMEAIRISQARAALNEAGVAAAPVASRRAARTAGGVTSGTGVGGGTGVSTAGGPVGEGPGAGRPSVPVQRSTAPRIPLQPHPGAVPDAGGSDHLTGSGPGGRKEGGRRKLPLVLAGVVGALLIAAPFCSRTWAGTTTRVRRPRHPPPSPPRVRRSCPPGSSAAAPTAPARTRKPWAAAVSSPARWPGRPSAGPRRGPLQRDLRGRVGPYHPGVPGRHREDHGRLVGAGGHGRRRCRRVHPDGRREEGLRRQGVRDPRLRDDRLHHA